MGWWNDALVPRATDVLLAAGPIQVLRERVCEGLHGEVLEIGFGSGLNTAHYPAAVTKVWAVEPSDVAWGIAQSRRRQPGPGPGAGPRSESGPPPVVRAGLDGQVLDLPDASVDSALSTFTLCTIPDVVAALREVRRVLRPGGALHFLEHGLAPDPGVARWQHRLTPIQRRVAAGCHLDRSITTLVEESGLAVEDVENFYLGGAVPGLKVASHLYLGRAVRR